MLFYKNELLTNNFLLHMSCIKKIELSATRFFMLSVLETTSKLKINKNGIDLV